MSTTRRLRQLFLYLGSSLVAAIIGFAAVLVLTRLLAPADYGLVGIFLSLLFLVAPLVSVSADGLIAVQKSTLTFSAYQSFQSSYIALAYICFALLQLAFLVAWLAGVFSEGLLLGVPIFGLIRFLASMATTEYVVEERAVLFGVMTIFNSLCSLLLTMLFIATLGSWGGWRIIAMLIADLLMLAIRYKGRLGLLIRPQLQRVEVRSIFAFGIPGLIAVGGSWALNEADKVIVAHETGLHQAGIYAAAAGLAGIMMTFNQSLTNALYPGMFRRLSLDENAHSKTVLHYVLIFGILASCFGILTVAAYSILGELLLPQRYAGASDVFIALVATGVVVSVYRPFGLLAEYLKWGRRRAVAITLGGSVTLLVGVLGVRHGGLLWAPAGIAVGYLCAALVLATGLSRNGRV